MNSCPECRAGKHGTCDGTSWDFDADEQIVCPCAAEDHWIAQYPHPMPTL